MSLEARQSQQRGAWPDMFVIRDVPRADRAVASRLIYSLESARDATGGDDRRREINHAGAAIRDLERARDAYRHTGEHGPNRPARHIAIGYARKLDLAIRRGRAALEELVT